MNKKSFTTASESGEPLELCVTRPTAKDRIDAQLVYNKNWALAERAGSTLRKDLDDLAEKHGLWDAAKRTRVNELESEIISLEKKLRGGATHITSKEEGKTIALRLRDLRGERLTLLRAKDDLYVYTAESHADTARVSYLIAVCTRTNDGVLYFKGYDDYVSRSDSKVAGDSMTAYLELMWADVSAETDSYEVTWLKKYGYADEKGRLTNPSGHLVDDEDRLIDENGRYVLKDGSFCDRDGVAVDKDGNYLIEYKEFDAEPLIEVEDKL